MAIPPEDADLGYDHAFVLGRLRTKADTCFGMAFGEGAGAVAAAVISQQPLDLLTPRASKGDGMARRADAVAWIHRA